MSASPTTPSQLYHDGVASGRFRADDEQMAQLAHLDRLSAELAAPVTRQSWKGVDVWRREDGEPVPKGIYLFGTVGRGKSMLMQLVFDAAPVTEKRRVHFHPFMEELHLRQRNAKPKKGVDMILQIASEVSQDARLLCFDEFFLTDIADAVMLGRLLDAFFQCGVTLCATSNWAPDDLFQGGINRGSILPFLEELKKNTVVLDLLHGVDWRLDEAEERLEFCYAPGELFHQVTDEKPQPGPVMLHRSEVEAMGATDGVYWFDFSPLCETYIGRPEYLNLCRTAKVVIISGLPRLTADMADAALRFVVLVDLLYEHQIPLRVYSHIDLDSLCAEGPAAHAFNRTASRIHGLRALEMVNT